MRGDEFERRRFQLAGNLRSLRKTANVSGYELGKRAGLSQSKISKIERARVTPSEDDVRKMAKALRLSPEVTADLRRQARGLHLAWTGHAELLADERKSQQARYGEAEDAAHLIETCTIAFPALLQTPRYAEQALRAARVWWKLPELDQQLVLRMQRQALLYDVSRTFRFLVMESAFRLVYGSADILDEQLLWLEEIASRPNIEIRCVPEFGPQLRMLSCVFSLFDRNTVVLELPSSDLTLREPEDVLVYARLFDAMWDQSEPCASGAGDHALLDLRREGVAAPRVG
jgi:transcriptional regulator with XRE-family HTH domain